MSLLHQVALSRRTLYLWIGRRTVLLATPTWGPTDIVNTVATQVYPAVIPCLTVGATVFVAFWIYHRVRGAL